MTEPTEAMMHAGCKVLLPAICRASALPQPTDGPDTAHMIEDARRKVAAIWQAMEAARQEPPR